MALPRPLPKVPGQRIRLPRQVPPLLIGGEYAKKLRRMVSGARVIYSPIVAAVKANIEAAKAQKTDRFDAGPYTLTELRLMLSAAARKFGEHLDVKSLEALAEKFAKRTADYQKIQLARQVRPVLGADPFFKDAKLASRISTFVKDNVSYIKRIPQTLHDDVSEIVESAAKGAWTTPELADTLSDRFGIAEDHAELIARDQIGSVYADVNHDRQRDLGVERFVWRTVNDERVRGDPDGKYPRALPSHYDLDGQVFSYDDPPQPEGADEPILPGDEIQCRCWAEPVLDDLFDDDEESDDEDRDQAPDDDDDDDNEERDDSADRLDYDSDEPRDEHGQWTSEAGGAAIKNIVSRSTEPGPDAAVEDILAYRHRFEPVREILEKGVEKQGFKPRVYPYDGNTKEVNITTKIPKHVLAMHNLRTGVIQLSEQGSASIEKFAKDFHDDPKGMRVQLEKLPEELTSTDPDRVTAAKELANRAEDMSAFLHEVNHGYGPIHKEDVFGSGLMVEELTSEGAARVQMKEHFGYDPDKVVKAFPSVNVGYQADFERTAEAIAKTYGLPYDHGKNILEAAAVEFKKQAPPARSRDDIRNEQSALENQYVNAEQAGKKAAMTKIDQKLKALPEVLAPEYQFALTVDQVYSRGPKGSGPIDLDINAQRVRVNAGKSKANELVNAFRDAWEGHSAAI